MKTMQFGKRIFALLGAVTMLISVIPFQTNASEYR